MKKVFIDGQAGTTGLEIYDRLKDRNDIQLVEIEHQARKDVRTKTEIVNSVDLVILCLPDAASIETVQLISNEQVKVLDASTAHRVHEEWAYGLAELKKEQRKTIRESKKVSNPGCYPTGFLLAVTPLVLNGIIPKDYPITIHAVSGYSGGGKKLIEKYEKRQADNPNDLWNYRPYAMSLEHKHLAEMKKYAHLQETPIFVPSVGHFERGMLVQIPLYTKLLRLDCDPEKILDIWKDYYHNEAFVRTMDGGADSYLEDGFLNPLDCNYTNCVDLFAFGNKDRILLVARLDNLGKGASGAAVQNMNLMLDFEETKGLV